MKKLFFGFISSFFILMLIWLTIGFVRYGDNVVNVHLDLEKTLEHLVDLGDGQINLAFDLVNTFNELDETFSSTGMPSWLSNFLSFSFVPLKFIFDLFMLIMGFMRSIIVFVFNPVFA